MCTQEEKTVWVHPFSHLGRAPFRVVGCRENAFRMPDGTTKAGGSCHHCGTGIRWEFVIADADGKTFVVGSDCVEKTGSGRLISQTRALINKRNREKAAAKREAQRIARNAAIEAELDRQREANGGLTDAEVVQAERVARGDKRAQMMREAATLLADGKRGFRDSVADDMRNGNAPRGKGREIAIEILAKATGGRKGSEAFAAEANRWACMFTEVDGIKW